MDRLSLQFCIFGTHLHLRLLFSQVANMGQAADYTLIYACKMNALRILSIVLIFKVVLD
jgi:hypothetical protein